MKKILSIVLLLVLLTISPVLAMFCNKCGIELPEASNFCPSCGKAVVGAFQKAPPMPNNSNNGSEQVNDSIQIITKTPTKPIEVTANISTNDYEIVDQIETLLTKNNCNVANIRAKELTLQHNTYMLSIEANYQNFNPYQRELHDLYVQKLKALKVYLQAWKSAESKHDTARSLAEKDKALFIISHINEAIETLINNGDSLSSVAKAKEIEMRVQKTTRNFVVTSSYLIVDNQRLRRGEPIWIIDVLAVEAKVLHMGHGQSEQSICGWVSIYDLERRSNWRSNPAFFYSEPSSTPTVIYETRPTPPIVIYKYKRKRCDPYHHRRKDRRRHKRHVVVAPIYW